MRLDRHLFLASLGALLLFLFVPESGALAQVPGGTYAKAPPAEAGTPDYAAWERTATRAEQQTEGAGDTEEALTLMRGYVVEWRATFQTAQTAGAARIATLRTQIDALGPAPAEGATEADEIAARRRELNDQLQRLQAPVVAADEAYRRADGIVREIDRILRERQADELLRLWPAPVNPANWPVALAAVRDASAAIYAESVSQWSRPLPQRRLQGNLPLIVAYVLAGSLALLRGRRLVTMVSRTVGRHVAPRWQKMLSFMLSLGGVILPVAGAALLMQALRLSTMLGTAGMDIANLLPVMAFAVFSAIWLGGRVFPKSDDADTPLRLPPERRAEGRFHVTAFGALIALDALRNTLVDPVTASDAATSVLVFPELVVGGILLVRMGQLLRAHLMSDTAGGEPASFRNRLIGLFGRGAQLIGIIGPVLAAIGYVIAAGALIYPAAMSLALLGFLVVLQDLVDTVDTLLRRRAEADEGALLPTLIGFGLTLLSLPVFALIWGARPADLSELWGRFLEGFSIGETRISPTAFMVFVAVFALGYAATRLLQGALRFSVLPKTRMDQGGQNAVLAGLGYLGVFLSALAAINAAGINLAGLAIVAGALSVGIGFGLQNIVSNFVSGIILLIERPVSEGDWIEVGNVQGIVKAISVRSTRIQTFERTDVIVPNTDLIAGRVTNWTRYNLTGRLIVPVSVAYGTDPKAVERVLGEIAAAEPLAVLNPAPQVLLMGFTPDAMLFEIRLILRDVNFLLPVRSAVNHEIVRRFAASGIALSLGAAAQAQVQAAPVQAGPA